MRGQWPKEIIVCLECGAVSADGMPSGASFEPIWCTERDVTHGPTQRVSVLPASLSEELAEALSECIDVAEEGWAYASDYFREKWECEKEIAKARSALTRYREAITEGAER